MIILINIIIVMLFDRINYNNHTVLPVFLFCVSFFSYYCIIMFLIQIDSF